MTAPTTDTDITPGVYAMAADVYHADPVPGGSLSSTGVRRLLPPSCPALFHHKRQHPEHKREFDFGHAAHQLVLGVGAEIHVIDAADYRSKDAREQKELAYTLGRIPLLEHEYEQVKAMAEALRAHPVAANIFAPGRGRAEQALLWRDPRTGVWCRALLDWMTHPHTGRRLIVGDYKTTRAADPESIQKAIHNYGYHQQAAWYLDGVKALGLHGDVEPAFLFAFQEKQAPYLVTVVEIPAMTLRIARDLNRDAVDVYRRCTADGHWPGYSDQIEYIGLPPYIENRYLQESK